ncbi:hypothetical protein DACRYDRAFT_22146, partial [Dacryopinax primogenitus]
MHDTRDLGSEKSHNSRPYGTHFLKIVTHSPTAAESRKSNRNGGCPCCSSGTAFKPRRPRPDCHSILWSLLPSISFLDSRLGPCRILSPHERYHPLPPYRAHYLGSSSPKSDPALYLSAVEALLQSFRLELQFPFLMEAENGRVSDVVPLVVNTMGWTKGLGARLLEQVEQLVQPTHVFEFPDSGETAHPLDQFPSSTLTPTGNGDDRQVYTLEPVQPSPRLSAYNAPLLRALSTMSYLHSHPPQEGQSTRWSTTPLCAQLPYEVDLRTAFDKIVLVGPGSEDVVPEELGTVLNGSLVAFL